MGHEEHFNIICFPGTENHVNQSYEATEERASLAAYWQSKKNRLYSELICLSQKRGGAGTGSLCFSSFIPQSSVLTAGRPSRTPAVPPANRVDSPCT